jgi:hypothetical protein
MGPPLAWRGEEPSPGIGRQLGCGYLQVNEYKGGLTRTRLNSFAICPSLSMIFQ